MVLRAALSACLVAIASGWIAYDQSDPTVCLVALTVAFTAWLTFATLMVLELVSDAEEPTSPMDSAPPATPLPRRWNGTGSPRLVDTRPPGNGFRRSYAPDEEGPAQC